MLHLVLLHKQNWLKSTYIYGKKINLARILYSVYIGQMLSKTLGFNENNVYVCHIFI